MARLDRKWQIVIVLFFVAGLNYAGRTAISTVFPLVRAGRGHRTRCLFVAVRRRSDARIGLPVI